jgi:hemerythrin superfamily protein
MDAITLLKGDHRAVERLFKQFEKAGDDATVEKRSLVDRIIEELSVHAAIEEQLFYPAVRAAVPGTEDMALESLEEHHIVKWVLSELDGMDPGKERFDAKVTVLIENVRHHVQEEETELFPQVRDELGRRALGDLGDALEAAKRVAPTHPHPRAPDEPPGNLVLGATAAVADRIGDAFSGVAQGSVNAVNDLIARLLDRKSPKTSPHGSTATRRLATKVRVGAQRATARTSTAKATGAAAGIGAGRTARAAAQGAAGTGRAAKHSVKRTATSARKAAGASSNQVASSAKRGATTTGRAATKAARSTGAAAKRAGTRTASTARQTARPS